MQIVRFFWMRWWQSNFPLDCVLISTMFHLVFRLNTSQTNCLWQGDKLIVRFLHEIWDDTKLGISWFKRNSDTDDSTASYNHWHIQFRLYVLAKIIRYSRFDGRTPKKLVLSMICLAQMLLSSIVFSNQLWNHCTMWLSFSKISSRGLFSFAPIFLRSNCFRQNIWGLSSVQFHLWSHMVN